jgi:hypothetical protein
MLYGAVTVSVKTIDLAPEAAAVILIFPTFPDVT